jgi:sarcosine oxidase subunit delta
VPFLGVRPDLGLRVASAPGIVGCEKGEDDIRIPCPICGERDRREFYYLGSQDYLDRPGHDVWSDAWDAYLHRRANSAEQVRDVWYHEAGCGVWLLVERNASSHHIASASLASEADA